MRRKTTRDQRVYEVNGDWKAEIDIDLETEDAKAPSIKRLHDKWTFARGLACDVLVDGEMGPYGYQGVIMSVGDLVLVESKVK